MINIAVKQKKELCENCTNLVSCMYHELSDDPIHECEEFELDTTNTNQQGMDKPAQRVQPVRIFQDLCSTCDHQSYCQLQEEKTIVLSCEQYN
jgi:hypothetical protein